MTDFKEFDKVEVKDACSGTKPGKVYTLRTRLLDGDLYATDRPYPRNTVGCSCINNWVLIPGPDLRKSILT